MNIECLKKRMVNVFGTDIFVDYGMELPDDFHQVVYRYFAKKVRVSTSEGLEDSRLYTAALHNKEVQDKVQTCHLVCLSDKSYIFLGKHKPFRYTFEVDPDEELYKIEGVPSDVDQVWNRDDIEEMRERLGFIGCWLAGMVGYPSYQDVNFEPILYIGTYSSC